MAESALTAPARDKSLAQWLKRRLFANWWDGLITVFFGAFVLWVLFKVVGWGIVDDVWSLENKDQCRGAAGACWSVIEARGRLILFGLYPYEQHWRSTLACGASWRP